MSSLNCVHCLGSDWVCENHTDRPSVITEGGCNCGGAAAPCTCNPGAEFHGWTEVFASTDPVSAQSWIH
jgi:hypothetical protein